MLLLLLLLPVVVEDGVGRSIDVVVPDRGLGAVVDVDSAVDSVLLCECY